MNKAVSILPKDILPVAELKKYGFENVPTSYDLAPTILKFLNIDLGKYNFDGKSLIK